MLLIVSADCQDLAVVVAAVVDYEGKCVLGSTNRPRRRRRRRRRYIIPWALASGGS